MKDLLTKAGQLASAAGDKVQDAAKGLKPEASDIKKAADFVVDTTSKAANEIQHLGKDALKTDLAKDAAAGAAIGAVMGVPVPVVGPVAGAVIGAGLGVYKNIKQGIKPAHAPALPSDATTAPTVAEKFEELTKLHELKTQGILTEDEFAAEKKKVLDR